MNMAWGARLALVAAGLLAANVLPGWAQGRIETSAGPVVVDQMAGGLDEPWGIAFLPDGQFLVTERPGRLMLFPASGGEGQALDGVPEVAERGQGGLLDVMIPRDFATSREVWLSYALADRNGAGTALGVGRLSDDGTALQDFRVVFAAPGTRGGNHFGSRIVEATDGSIFLTMGERGNAPLAQDQMTPQGKVLHFNRDGSPATSNPGMMPGVHSLGHRNPQGAVLDADGQLWVVEHGAQGGDELNRVRQGANYGWPVIAYGEDYGGGKIGEGTARDGMEQPVMYWDPSIAPSGLMFYQGDLFPAWKGDVFTGSLKFDYLSRLDPDTGYAEERISGPETGRVRDVVEGPDGAIWFLSVIEGAVFRMVPAT
jgi:aldose sugar dehydrogenase